MTKHRRNFEFKAHCNNLILKRAARVIVTLCFLFTEPIPCLAGICQNVNFRQPLGRYSRETGTIGWAKLLLSQMIG